MYLWTYFLSCKCGVIGLLLLLSSFESVSIIDDAPDSFTKIPESPSSASTFLASNYFASGNIP